ncbi:MAG: flagellar basal body L-ring protein FlgH [Planctomycetes bacterium]|nr:flagellar basal body L-ring protein FlgH [Planctomycetota bacterium]
MKHSNSPLLAVIVLSSLVLPAGICRPDSIWGSENMIGDKTYRVHDLISIVIKEASQAQTENDTSTEKDSSRDLDLIDFFGLKGRGLKEDNPSSRPAIRYRHSLQRTKNGEIRHKEQFTARITARIVEVLPNGNLVFEARKTVRIGEEESTIVFSGEVRPQDVDADNTVYSDNVADARIEYRGRGEVTDAVKRGWLSRLFDYTNIF